MVSSEHTPKVLAIGGHLAGRFDQTHLVACIIEGIFFCHFGFGSPPVTKIDFVLVTEGPPNQNEIPYIL